MVRRRHQTGAHLSGVLVLLLGLGISGVHAFNGPSSSCRNIPGDVGWPSQETWASLNHTVHGRLISTVPQASICHLEPYHSYNATACQLLQDRWNSPETFEVKPAEMLNPTPQNQSCDPYTPKEKPCVLDNYPVFSINVTGVADVVAGIRFAKDNNIRLTIKNTGHDYQGKSVGLGSLSLWTHNLQTLEVIRDYKDEGDGSWDTSYHGPAAKIGAGVIGGVAYTVLGAQGYRIVGGSCPSVGIAGGYTPGAGHSILNSKYGMAADNVLEWEVVTAQGVHLVATPTKNKDLYWALSGGGAGTFAVVLSMTTKIFPEGPVGSGSLSFNDTLVGNETYWKAVSTWFEYLPSLVSAPGGNTFGLMVTSHVFEVVSITLPDSNGTHVAALLAPFLAALERLEVDYHFETRTDPNFVEHFTLGYGPLPYGGYPPNTLFSSRLIPRSVIEDPIGRQNVMKVYQDAVAEDIFIVGCHCFDVQNATHPDNAVLPAWRDAVAICNYVAYWDWTVPRSVMDGYKEQLVNEWMPAIEQATPGSGIYLNEVDSLYAHTGDWKSQFYGVNYPRLKRIKNKYDPDEIFYAITAVGSEKWSQDSAGRLCRTRE